MARDSLLFHPKGGIADQELAHLRAANERLRAALAEAEAVWKSCDEERREILLANDSLARERDEARRERDEALVHVHHGPFVRWQGTEAEHDCETMAWAYLEQERDTLRAALDEAEKVAEDNYEQMEDWRHAQLDRLGVPQSKHVGGLAYDGSMARMEHAVELWQAKAIRERDAFRKEREDLRAALRAVVEAAVCVLAICDCISDEDDPKYGVPKTALRAALTEARRVLENTR